MSHVLVHVEKSQGGNSAGQESEAGTMELLCLLARSLAQAQLAFFKF